MARRSGDGSETSVDTLVEGRQHAAISAKLEGTTPSNTIQDTYFSGTAWQKEEDMEAMDDPGAIVRPLLEKLPPPSRARWSFATLLGFKSHPAAELRSTAWLDGLRGLAAFEVFIFHYLDGWTEHSRGWGQDGPQDRLWWRLPFIRSLYASGDTAVCIFFAISGYVLTYKMLTLLRQNRRQDLYSSIASAMFRRGVRLYMPVIIESFLLMMLGRVGFPKASGYKDAPTIFLELKRWFWSMVHLLMPLRYPDRWNEILNIYDGNISWTIPLEYYGSMVVYATLMFFSRTRSFTVRMCLLSAMVVTSFLRDDWIGGQFLLGMAFADWQLEQEAHADASTRKKSSRRLLFVCLFIFGFYLSGLPFVALESDYKLTPRPFYDWISQPLAYIGVYADRKGDRYLNCLAGLCILIGIGETPQLKRIMETRFVQYLGKISFGLYLCHIFLHKWLKPLDGVYLALAGLTPETAETTGGFRLFLAFCMMMVPSTIVNFAVGSLFERYLDRPSVRAAKLFEQWCLDKA